MNGTQFLPSRNLQSNRGSGDVNQWLQCSVMGARQEQEEDKGTWEQGEGTHLEQGSQQGVPQREMPKPGLEEGAGASQGDGREGGKVGRSSWLRAQPGKGTEV